MKIGYMALLAALAVNTAVAAGAKIAGFEIGETIDVLDADVRTARSLATPATVVLGQVPFTYYSCESTRPADGYDEVSIDVSTNKTVMCVSAIVKCKDEAESKRRRDEIASKLKAEFADRISEDGKTHLEVSCGKDYVGVELTTCAFRNTTDENNRLAADSKRNPAEARP